MSPRAEVDGLAGRLVDDGELSGPVVAVDEIDDVDQPADAVDLAGERDPPGGTPDHRATLGSRADPLEQDQLSLGSE